MYETQSLPVSPDQVDSSTFNNNLPQGNEIFPQIRLPQSIHPQMASDVVSMFRTHVQSRATKSRLHCFVYNLFARNRFANPLFTDWCQRAVDFADFLKNVQRNADHDAVQKAAAKMYLSSLSAIAADFPSVAQMMLDGVHQAGQNAEQARQQLVAQAQEFNDIQRDIQAYQQQRAGAGQYGSPQYGSGGHAPAPVNNSAQHLLSTYAPTASASAPATHHQAQVDQGGRGSGMYLEPAPKVQPQSWTAGQPAAPASTAPQGGGMSQFEDFESDLPVPQTVDELVVDPRHYMPRGFVIDLDRPYDEIHAPGGIEIRPAHKTTWARTVGDDQPYRVTYDAQRFILFYAKWPDGRVKEVLVEANKPEMEYLLHEINDELRAKAIRPNGKVVASTAGIVDSDKPAQTVEAIRHELDDHIDDVSALSPVILDRVFCGTSQLEDEREAKMEVVSLLGLDPAGLIPAHEYRSYRFHPMDITQECYLNLTKLREFKSYEAVASNLKLQLDGNILPIRYYRFLNDRLTDAVNTYLKDALSLKQTIDSFVDDIAELGPYLARKLGAEYQKVFDSSVANVLGRALTFGEVEDEAGEGEEPVLTWGLTEQYINFQVGWTQQDLENLQVGKEPVLLSRYTHPRIVNVVKGMILRAKENELLDKNRLRIITVDGCYYEVIRGKLIDTAILLKRV